jgi:hypothetical protein
MIWKYDACGTYADYKGYTIIDQQHPNLIRYEICFAPDDYSELKHIGLSSTINDAKELINNIIKTSALI